jgi:hypothetical protein
MQGRMIDILCVGLEAILNECDARAETSASGGRFLSAAIDKLCLGRTCR